MNNNGNERKCPTCGKAITDGRKIYCNITCRAAAKKQPITRACAICGKTFTTTRPHKLYCGAQCRRKVDQQLNTKYVSAARKRNRDAQGVLANRQCKNCGKSFTPRQVNQVYCSHNCVYISYRRRTAKKQKENQG